MNCKIRDRQPYYEAYDNDGNLAASGTSEEVNEAIGGRSANSITIAIKKGYSIEATKSLAPLFTDVRLIAITKANSFAKGRTKKLRRSLNKPNVM